MHLHDPDEHVRQKGVLVLDTMFAGLQDREILRLAITAFDNPQSSVAMRWAAGAVMMYQLGTDDKTEPAWWNEEEEDLKHPNILRTVATTRQVLSF